MREFRKTELYGVVYPDGEHGHMGVLGEDGPGVHTRCECRAFPSLAPVCLVAGGAGFLATQVCCSCEYSTPFLLCCLCDCWSSY